MNASAASTDGTIWHPGESPVLLHSGAADADIGIVSTIRTSAPPRRLGTADLDLLERVFGEMPDRPCFVKDRDGRYVLANQAMAALTGASSPQALQGRCAEDCFPAPLARRYVRLDSLVLRGQTLRDQLDFLLDFRLSPTWLLFSRLPVFDEAGEVAGILAVARRLPAPDRNHPTYARLATVAGRIAEDFASPLEVDALARLAGVSVSQLERDFRRLFGLTPRAYLHKRRVDRALELLDTGLSVADIAYACGYADHSAFTRRFRSMVGMTPTQYRSRRMPEPRR